jgi:formylglycine-generating enzyme required for sulfatase activity
MILRRLAVGGAAAAAVAMGAAGTFAWTAWREGPVCRHQDGMALIPAGTVLLGEDGPGRPGAPVQVEAFSIDRTEVTNKAFAAFVKATGYVTDAEREGRAAVFVQPARLDRGIDDPSQWWRMIKGASWRRPEGPGGSLAGRWSQPVVEVTFKDARAYARWRGGDLPTEAQWERAARGNQQGPRDPQGWTRDRQGRPAANTWQGVFPLFNDGKDGYARLAPVGCFAANDFGLYDMIGNAWEWTRKGEQAAAVRGGSFLCSRDYCANYRPAGRQAQDPTLGASHIGFRIVKPVAQAASHRAAGGPAVRIS